MKNAFSRLNKAFENRTRLGIMSILMVEEEVAFNEVKERLQLTDGNLASHANGLEKAGFIEIKKRFEGKKPLTTYTATADGKAAFTAHIDALEAILKGGI